jgi:hypothetical protein
VATVAHKSEPRPEQIRQNWIVNPTHDLLWIIAAPLIAWIWAAFTFKTGGLELVWTIFMVFNVAHHFPTFVRIYGDRDLLRRYRWNLLLGPIIPFSVSMAVVFFVVVNDLNIFTLLFLQVILNIWDPWHFLMQHYGFMRIYDRHNKAPRKLAGRMDYALCTSWFLFILVASSEWLFDLLYKLYSDGGLGLVMLIDQGVYRFIYGLTLGASVVMSFVYLGYLNWLRRKGFYISPAKIALFLVTFITMGLCYVRNPLMQQLLPGWTFMAGFATLGMVHVSQYLAIVWTYNRNLAGNEEKSRPGLFKRWFLKGGLAAASLYVVACLMYGSFLSNELWRPVFILGQGATFLKYLFGIIVSLSFTSTLMHYYYDGFIWKVRHKENHQNLVQPGQAPAAEPSTEAADAPAHSWWSRADGATTAGRMFLKQAVYFGAPMLFVLLMTSAISRTSPSWPLRLGAQVISSQQWDDQLAEQALAAIERQSELERKMQKLIPRATAKHYTYLGELQYFKALLLNAEARQRGEWLAGERDEFRDALQTAVDMMQESLERPAPFYHRENMELDRDTVQQRINDWRRELASPGLGHLSTPSMLVDRQP